MAADNNIIGEVGLLVTPVQSAGFDAKVKKIIDDLERSGKVNLNPNIDTTNAEAAVNRLAESTGSVAAGWAQAATQVAAFSAAVYGAKRAVEGTIQKFSGLFDQLAQARAGFTSILGSEQAGNKLLDDIREFARVSPFVTQQLVNYSQQLLGVGKSAETIIPLLKHTGDIVASVGGDTSNLGRVLFTLTQIQSVGRLAGQDALQLQSALIPITKYLSEFLGKSTAEIKKLQEQGKISADTVFAAINAQGEKVKGAMDRATRNITGARAILGDTITILKQNQPVLQQIFDDTFHAILKLSDFLSTPEFTASFNHFFEGVQKVYEGLKPLGGALANLAKEGSLSALDTFGSLFETLAVVLNAIPQPVLKLVAQFFASLSVLKAPLLLLKYVQNIQMLAAGAFTAARNINETSTAFDRNAIAATQTATAVERAANVQIAATRAMALQTGLAKDVAIAAWEAESMAAQVAARAEIAAIEQTTAAQNAKRGLLSRGVSKLGGLAALAGAGALMAGTQVSDNKGGARDAFGNILTYTGIGATVGSALGPAGTLVGTAVGAAGGAAVGAISAIFTSQAKHRDAAKKAAEDAANDYAKKFLQTLDVQFGSADSNAAITGGFKEIGKEFTRQTQVISEQEKKVTEIKKRIEQINSEVSPIAPGGLPDTTARDKKLEEQGKALRDAQKLIAEAKKDQEKLFTGDSQFVKGLDTMASKLALVQKSTPDLLRPDKVNRGTIPLLKILQGQEIPKSLNDMNNMERSLATFGLTFQDVINNTPDQIAEMVRRFKDLPDAIKDATRASIEFNTAWETGKTNAETTLKPFIDQAKHFEAQLKATKETADGFNKLMEKSQETGQLVLRKNIDLTEINALGQQFFTDAALASSKAMDAGATAAEAQTASIRNLAGNFQLLQKTLGLSDEKFKKLLVDARLWDAFSTTLDKNIKVNVSTIDELSKQTGVATDKLKELLNLPIDDKNTQIISSDKTVALIGQLKAVERGLGQEGIGLERINSLEAQRKSLLKEIQASVDAITLANGEAAATALFGPFLRAAQRYISSLQDIKSLNDAFASVFSRDESNPQVQALKIDKSVEKFSDLASTILQRGVSALQAFSEQFKDTGQASELAAAQTVEEFLTLQKVMGLTDDEFKNLLITSGAWVAFQNAQQIAGDVFVGTLEQVAGFLGISSDKARELFASLGLISDTTVIAIDTSQIDAALKKIRELQAEKDLVSTFFGGEEAAKAVQAKIDEQQKVIDAAISGATPKPTPFNEALKKQDDERIAREAKQAADDAKRAQEQAQREAEDAAKRAEEELRRWQETVESTTESLTSRIQQAADAIVQAAEKWTATIKERTQFDAAVSVTSATRNASKQADQIAEMTRDLANLQARGVGQNVLSALGVSGLSSLRQVRKLVNASDADLGALSAAVTKRDTLAQTLAQSQEDTRTRANITQAIIDAAKALGMDTATAKSQAASISNQFNITPGLNAEDIAFQILNILSAGKISR